MTNKSPYEIRLDVLKMAQDMLEHESRLKVQSLVTENAALAATNQYADNSHIVNGIASATYTPEQLTTRASQLYEFVKSKT